MFQRVVVCAVAIVIAAVAASGVYAVTFGVTDLCQYANGVGSGMVVRGICSDDQYQYVTGWVYVTEGQRTWPHAFRYRVGDSAISDIHIPGALHSQGSEVNRNGQVVGFFHDGGTDPGFHDHPFINTPGSGSVLPGANTGDVNINSNGQIAGMAWYMDDYDSGHTNLMYFDGVNFNNLGLVDSVVSTGGINDSSWIAGGVLSDHGSQAFVNKPTNEGGRQTILLGYFPDGVNSVANDINNSGKVVGAGIMVNSEQHAFVSVPTSNGYGELQDLGVLGISGSSFAQAINNNDWIVGQSGGDGFLAISDGSNYVMHNLNDLLTAGDHQYWTIQSAIGITDSNYILAIGVHNGTTYPVLLAPVPEPSGLLLSLVGNLSLLVYAWRRRRAV